MANQSSSFFHKSKSEEQSKTPKEPSFLESFSGVAIFAFVAYWTFRAWHEGY